MDNSESSLEIRETPSSIVRIAYRQLSIMTGMSDLSEPKLVNENQVAKNQQNCAESEDCMKRFFQLPVFSSVTSSMCNAYTTVKQSHESITTVFDSVENGLSKGAEYVSPLTNRIGDTLETPLKTVGNAVCIGLDYLGKVPSIISPPYEIYENISNSVRDVTSSVVNTCVIFLTNIVGRVDRLEASIERNAQDDKNNNNNEKAK